MDIGKITILSLLMQAIADSDLDRASSVKSLPTESETPNAFDFEVGGDDWLTGKWKITLERMDGPPQESALSTE